MHDFHNYDESLEERSFFFKYQGKSYVLREPSGDAVTQYKDKAASCVQYNREGSPIRVVGMAAVEPLLVALCTFEILDDEKEKPVAQAVIKRWPGRMQKELFEKAKQFGDLVDETAERQTLDEILSRSDSPVSVDAFKKYVRELPDKDEKYDYRPFKLWYLVADEALTKNEPSDMQDGSA